MNDGDQSQLCCFGDELQQGLVGLDHSQRIAYVNPTFAKLVQRRTEELIGQEFDGYFEDSQRSSLRQRIAQSSHIIERAEFDLETMLGSVRRLRLAFQRSSTNPASASEQVDGAIVCTVLATDLSETAAGRQKTRYLSAANDPGTDDETSVEAQLHNSRLELRQLADVVPLLVFAAGPDGTIDWFNRRWTQYTGIGLRELCDGGWQRAHDPEVLPEVVRIWRETVESGESNSMTFPLQAADGTFATFLCRVAPVRDRDGRVTKWFGTCTDINEQQQVQEELRRIAAELSESDRRKNEFLAILAHELRNPLTPIKSAVQLMQLTDGMPSEFSDLFNIVDRQVNHMTHLINDLLDISRISRGKINLRLETCDMRQVVKDAVEAVLPLIVSAEHQLQVDLSEHALPVIGDRTRLLQILINLLTNAAKYTQDPGQIWVSAQVIDQSVAIEVRDTGIGISSEEQTKVFHMFHQVHSDKLDGHSGLGIGLSLVKSLVQMHDGKISVSSPGVGQGTTFRMTLPLRNMTTEGPTVAATTDDNGAAFESMKVLVVDDARGNRVILSRLLRKLGQEVVEASNGAEALKLAETFAPDIIISDISMPVMNGYEMARELRQNGSQACIVALSGFGQDSDLDAAKAAGFDECLVKPVDVRDLQQLLRELKPSTS